MFCDTLAASSLGSLLSGKSVIRPGSDKQNVRVKENFLVSPYSLTDLKIQTYYQNEPRFIQEVIYGKI